MVLNTLKVWYQFRKHFKFVTSSPVGPLCRNHLFPPSSLDSTFLIWHNKGIRCFADLYSKGIFGSFTNVSSLYGLPVNHLFRYLQVRHFVSKSFSNFPFLPPQQPWDRLLDFKPQQRGIVSEIYNCILDLCNYSNSKT